jgi:hypothetical protein
MGATRWHTISWKNEVGGWPLTACTRCLHKCWAWSSWVPQLQDQQATDVVYFSGLLIGWARSSFQDFLKAFWKEVSGGRSPLKEGFSASNETLNNPRRRDLPCLMKGNWWQRQSSRKLRLANDLSTENRCVFWSKSESLQTTRIWNLKWNRWAVVEKWGQNYWSLDFDNLNSKISWQRQIQQLWNLARR